MFSDLKSNRVSYGFWQIEKQTAVSSFYFPSLGFGTVVKLGEAGEKVTKEKCRVGGMVKEKALR